MTKREDTHASENRFAQSPTVRLATRFWRWAKPWSVPVLRVGAVWTVILAILIAYDIVAPTTREDEAVVTKLTRRRMKSGITYDVHAHGRKEYLEGVARVVWEKVQVGDHLRLQLTPFFGEWKQVVVLRDGRVIETFSGEDRLYMILFSLFFLVPLLFFRKRDKVEESPLLLLGGGFLVLIAEFGSRRLLDGADLRSGVLCFSSMIQAN